MSRKGVIMKRNQFGMYPAAHLRMASLPLGKGAREEYLHVIVQAANGAACTALGFVFVQIYLQKNHKLDFAVLLAAAIVMALTVAEYSLRWFQLITGKKELVRKRGVPAVLMALLWITATVCKGSRLPGIHSVKDTKSRKPRLRYFQI